MAKKLTRIIFCDVDDVTQRFLEQNAFKDKTDDIIFEESLNDLSDDVLSRYSDVEIISPFIHSRLTPDILKHFGKLKLIAVRSTGYNNIDTEYCKAHGIKVANVAGYGEITLAEYALGLLLNLTRKIGFSSNKLRSGVINIPDDVGIDLHGRTVGVVGTGAIGRHFAKICTALGCNVIAYDLYPNQKLVDAGILKYVDMDYLFKNSDIISLHCPATKENYHLINKNTIAQMKDGIFIINTSRGELIDAVDLYDAVLAGKIGGAGLDVLEHEDIIIKNDMQAAKDKDKNFALYSLINFKLLQLPKVIVTPHIGFNSSDAVLRILNTTVQTIFNFLDGKPIPSVI